MRCSLCVGVDVIALCVRCLTRGWVASCMLCCAFMTVLCMLFLSSVLLCCVGVAVRVLGFVFALWVC